MTDATLQALLKKSRAYQLELFDRAKAANVIIYLDTGSGKTFVSVLLIRFLHGQAAALYQQRKGPRPFAVFLAPTVALVEQQSGVLKCQLDLKVAKFYGQMNPDSWDRNRWHQEANDNDVVVMTPAILYHVLSSGFWELGQITLLVFDEAHHCIEKHPYNLVMRDFYHTLPPGVSRPHIFGMTASPLNRKGENEAKVQHYVDALERNLDAKVLTVVSRAELEQHVPVATTLHLEFAPSALQSLHEEMTLLERAIHRTRFAHDYKQMNTAVHYGVIMKTDDAGVTTQEHVALDGIKTSTTAQKYNQHLTQIKEIAQVLGPYCAAYLLLEVLRSHGYHGSQMMFIGGSKMHKSVVGYPTPTAPSPAEPTKEASVLQSMAYIGTSDAEKKRQQFLADLQQYQWIEKDIQDEDKAISRSLCDATCACARMLCRAASNYAVQAGDQMIDMHVRDIDKGIRGAYRKAGRPPPGKNNDAGRESDTPSPQLLVAVVHAMCSCLEGVLQQLPATALENEVHRSSDNGALRLPTTEPRLMSPKLVALARHLHTYKDAAAASAAQSAPDQMWSCIVFVKTRLATYAVSACLLAMPQLASWLRTGFVLGSGGTLKALDVPTQVQNQVLEHFRCGTINCLVATSVAEEGLDLKGCQLVVRFDLPDQPRSMIQSRGRARAKQSKMVFMVQQGSEDVQSIHNHAAAELNMRRHIWSNNPSAAIEEAEEENIDMEQLLDSCNKAADLYIVESTNARVSLVSAPQMLNQLCDKMQMGDRYTDVRPRYSTSIADDAPNTFKSVVLLPPNSPVKHAYGNEQPSRDVARASAALEAIIIMHKKGFLDDHLRPTWGPPSNKIEPAAKEIPDELRGGRLQATPPAVELQLQTPTALRGPTAAEAALLCKTRRMLYLHILEYTTNGCERAISPWGLLLWKALPEDLLPFGMWLQAGVQSKALFRCCGPVSIEDTDVRRLKNLHRSMVKSLLWKDLKPPPKVSTPKRRIAVNLPTHAEELGWAVRALMTNNQVFADHLCLAEVACQEEQQEQQQPDQPEAQQQEDDDSNADNTNSYELEDEEDSKLIDDSLWASGPVGPCQGPYFILAPVCDGLNSSVLVAALAEVAARGAESVPPGGVPSGVPGPGVPRVDWAYVRVLEQGCQRLGQVMGCSDVADFRTWLAEDKAGAALDAKLSGSIVVTSYNHLCYEYGHVDPSVSMVHPMPQSAEESVEDAPGNGHAPTSGLGKGTAANDEDPERKGNYRRFTRRFNGTFLEYYRQAKGIEGLCPTQPLVFSPRCIGSMAHGQSLRRTDYLRDRVPRAPKASTASKASTIPRVPIHLVPETLLIHPLTNAHWHGLAHIRSAMWRLQSLLLACDVRQAIIPPSLRSSVPDTSLPTVTDVLTAITLPSCHDIWDGKPLDGERLESLGDCVLKFLVCQYLYFKYDEFFEGQLSLSKHYLVSNHHLWLRARQKLPIQGFIRCTSFVDSVIMWPGRYRSLDRVQTRMVRGKVLGDVIEALLGCAYVRGGPWATLCTLVHLNVLPEDALQIMQPLIAGRPVAPLLMQLNIDTSQDGVPEQYCSPGRASASLAAPDAPPAALAQLCSLDHCRTAVENVLGYKFADEKRLFQAVSHPSLQGVGWHYQRLEYLGDAVLDLLITHRLYLNFPDIQPHMLTVMREADVNGERLSRLCVVNTLMNQLQHESQVLFNDCTAFAGTLRNMALELISSTLLPPLLLSIKELKQQCRTGASEQHVAASIRDQLAGVRAQHPDCITDAAVAKAGSALQCWVSDGDRSNADAGACEALISLLEPVAMLKVMVPGYGGGDRAAPKVLGDMIEALLAAVYLDSGLDLQCCWHVVRRLYRGTLVTPATVPLQPVAQATTLAHKAGRQLRFLEVPLPPDVPDHCLFAVQASIDDEPLGDACAGKSLRAARLAAAEAVLELWQADPTLLNDSAVSQNSAIPYDTATGR